LLVDTGKPRKTCVEVAKTDCQVKIIHFEVLPEI